MSRASFADDAAITLEELVDCSDNVFEFLASSSGASGRSRRCVRSNQLSGGNRHCIVRNRHPRILSVVVLPCTTVAAAGAAASRSPKAQGTA